MSLFLLPLFAATMLTAQDRIPVVMGSIRNLDGQPVRAAVQLQRAGTKTKTDKRGLFFLQNVEPDDTLLIRYNHINTQVAVSGRQQIHIKLADNLADLIRPKEKPAKKADKAESGGNVFTSEDLIRTGGKNLIEALSSIGGATITPEGGVILRGFTSFYGSSNAMILVDGTEVTSLLDVELMDVSKVEYQKNGEMYGVRGANGVVLITTKSGRE